MTRTEIAAALAADAPLPDMPEPVVEEPKKQKGKPMQIVFCLPGKQFSNRFLACWTNTLVYCLANGITPIMAQAYSPNIYYVRQMCLGADVTRGKQQQPFDGKLDYDFICWLDSDSVWTPQQIQRLLNHNVDVVGALQAHDGGGGYTCGWLSDDHFQEHGFVEYLTDESLKDHVVTNAGLLPVDYCGFGMLLVKRGVYERLEYPWHRPEWFKYEDVQDFSMEDAGACMNIKRAGFNIYVDPQVRVGHEKTAIFQR